MLPILYGLSYVLVKLNHWHGNSKSHQHHYPARNNNIIEVVIKDLWQDLSMYFVMQVWVVTISLTLPGLHQWKIRLHGKEVGNSYILHNLVEIKKLRFTVQTDSIHSLPDVWTNYWDAWIWFVRTWSSTCQTFSSAPALQPSVPMLGESLHSLLPTKLCLLPLHSADPEHLSGQNQWVPFGACVVNPTETKTCKISQVKEFSLFWK
jgi:hypothetical protein